MQDTKPKAPGAHCCQTGALDLPLDFITSMNGNSMGCENKTESAVTIWQSIEMCHPQMVLFVHTDPASGRGRQAQGTSPDRAFCLGGLYIWIAFAEARFSHRLLLCTPTPPHGHLWPYAGSTGLPPRTSSALRVKCASW